MSTEPPAPMESPARTGPSARAERKGPAAACGRAAGAGLSLSLLRRKTAPGLVAAALAATWSIATAQTRAVPDRFTATTSAAMSPAGISLSIDVSSWSTADARAAVADALSALMAPAQDRPDGAGRRGGGPPPGDDPPEGGPPAPGGGPGGNGQEAVSLSELPTVGYVWTAGSAVGHSIKYAHREPAEAGGETITLVTADRIGRFGNRPWQLEGTTAPAGEAGYSVVVLNLDADGRGSGTLSLGAAARVEDTLVALETPPGRTALLEDVRLEPPPYWASPD